MANTNCAKKATSGTREWADSNVNCVDGCAHDCKYCYAKRMAKRFGRATDDSWKVMHVREKDVRKAYNKREGRIMFPTSHDLVPNDPSFASCMVVLGKLLASGNQVLVTTKPHLAAIKQICNAMERYRQQIQFRFTITSANDKLLAYWEPGAPAFAERLASLEYAALSGYRTSVSIEPILDRGLNALDDLYERVVVYCTESVWLGTMNYFQDPHKLDARLIYRHFQGRPLVRFKDSIRNVVEGK
jgi:DNA repair photolyase